MLYIFLFLTSVLRTLFLCCNINWTIEQKDWKIQALVPCAGSLWGCAKIKQNNSKLWVGEMCLFQLTACAKTMWSTESLCACSVWTLFFFYNLRLKTSDEIKQDNHVWLFKTVGFWVYSKKKKKLIWDHISKKKTKKKTTTDLRSVSQQKYSRFLLMAPTCVIWGKTKTNKYSNTVNGNSWLRVKNRMRQEGLTPACTLRMGHSTQLHFSGAFV